MSGERPAAGDGPTTYEAMIQNMGNLKRISTSVSEASDSNKKTTIEIVTLFGTIKDTILKLMTRKDIEGKAIDQMKIIHGKEMSELQGKHDEAINNANINDEELTKLRGAIQAANENYNTNTNTIIADIMEISNNNTIITNLNDLVTQINELDALIHGKNDNPIQPLGPGDNDGGPPAGTGGPPAGKGGPAPGTGATAAATPGATPDVKTGAKDEEKDDVSDDEFEDAESFQDKERKKKEEADRKKAEEERKKNEQQQLEAAAEKLNFKFIPDNGPNVYKYLSQENPGLIPTFKSEVLNISDQTKKAKVAALNKFRETYKVPYKLSKFLGGSRKKRRRSSKKRHHITRRKHHSKKKHGGRKSLKKHKKDHKKKRPIKRVTFKKHH